MPRQTPLEAVAAVPCPAAQAAGAQQAWAALRGLRAEAEAVPCPVVQEAEAA